MCTDSTANEEKERWIQLVNERFDFQKGRKVRDLQGAMSRSVYKRLLRPFGMLEKKLKKKRNKKESHRIFIHWFIDSKFICFVFNSMSTSSFSSSWMDTQNCRNR